MASDAKSILPRHREKLRELARAELGLLVVVALALVYVLNAWTPSHYGHASRLLGIANAGPVFGKARPIRSDEWGVTTPYFQIAVANHLGPRDEFSPYKESLRTFFALPSRDWSMAFKPDLWGFLFLDPAHAYSLHYAMLAVTMLAGFAILLRQFGCSPGYALAVSVMLFLSQFVQVWWSSNAPVLAMAPWPVVALLWRAHWFLRAAAIAYAVAAWLIGQLYPPFILAAGVAFAFLVAAFRPDALSPRRLVPAVLAGAAGAGVAWLYYAELIPVMAATVYPGRRINQGVGVHLSQLLANVFPNFVTSRYEPLPLWPSNACEIGVVGTLLPLAVGCFCEFHSLARWAHAHMQSLVTWLAGLALLAAWMTLPIPSRFEPLLDLAPPNRLIWAFGLLLLLGLAVVAAASPWVLTRNRVLIFVAALFAAWAVSKLMLSKTPGAFLRFDLIGVPVLLGLLAARRWAGDALPDRRLALVAMVMTTAVTFGLFNPVQSAEPIFARHDSATLDVFRAYAAANPRHLAVAPGMYGSALNGAGVPAINHTLLRPQPEMFRAAYAPLDPGGFDAMFNRYAHIEPATRWTPTLIQDDLISLPPDSFAIPLRVEIAPPTTGAAPPGGCDMDQFEAVRLGARRWGVSVAGSANWSGVDAAQGLRVSLARRDLGRIVRASAYRLPRPDIVAARHDPSAFAAGFGLRLEIETANDLAAFPRDGLSLVSIDGRQGVAALMRVNPPAPCGSVPSTGRR